MKKQTLILLLSISFVTNRTEAACCGLDNVFYKIGSFVGRNDYLYLVYTNSVWFLNKKIALKEDLDTIDSYYLRLGCTIYSKHSNRQYGIGIYYTPLHEAVYNGSLECVQALCYAGADKNKQIKSSFDRDFVYLHQSIIWCSYPVDHDQLEAEKEKVLVDRFVGLSALELAEKLATDGSNESGQAIYNFLKQDN